MLALRQSKSICSDEGLTLETSAFQSLYGGQFTLSTPLINQIFDNYSACTKTYTYTKTIIHLSVGESGRYLPRRFATR